MSALRKLWVRLEEFYEQEEEDFGNMERTDSLRPVFVISTLEWLIGSRPVHMPGHPESVLECDRFGSSSILYLLCLLFLKGGIVPCA